MDLRLRAAVDATIGWYEEIFALHGISTRLEGGIWSADGPPPPFHSAAIAVEPGVAASAMLDRLSSQSTGGFADPFADVDGASIGMRILFEATWIHRPAGLATLGASAEAWTDVRTADELAVWNAGYDTADVLLLAVLDSPHISIVARTSGGRRTAGAVLRAGDGTVQVSNVHGLDGQRVDWLELAALATACYPDREVVGYERGDDLDDALAAGWEPVGITRVWVR